MRFVSWILLVALLGGCHQDREAEGPAERAGKQVDRAADKTGDALERAAEKTSEAAKKAVHATGEALEKAGQKLKGDDGAATRQRPAKPTSVEAKPAESKPAE